MMKKSIQLIFTFLTLTLILSACYSLQPDSKDSEKSTTTLTPTEKPGLVIEETNLFQLLTEGPLLLLQTDIDQYEFIDAKNNRRIPFDQPGAHQQYDLKKNISPGGSLMLFQTNDEEVIVKSLVTGNVVTSLDIPYASALFSTEMAAENLLDSSPELNMTGEELQAAIRNSHYASISTFKWSNNDQHLFTALPGSETSTCLHIHDLQSGSSTQLEYENGIVEDFWISPVNDHILLKKGFISDPPYWQDDRYYLLNLKEESVTPINMPDNVERPSVFWFSSGYIGIVHQLELVGGNRFSLLDIQTMESHLLIPESFNGLIDLGGNLLSLHQNEKSQTTLFKTSRLSGEMLRSKELDGVCQIRTVINENECLISCEDRSFLFELETFSIDHFGNPIRLVSFDPDHGQFIFIDYDGQVSLCQNPHDECQDLTLDNGPIEILWLPDSSGFLYLAANSLFYYDISSHTEKFLLTSDIFGDYRNLNAVWVNISNP